jgi:hypothetical protein
MAKAVYKPLGLVVSVLGGVVASSLFRSLWRRIAREEEASQATNVTEDGKRSSAQPRSKARCSAWSKQPLIALAPRASSEPRAHGQVTNQQMNALRRGLAVLDYWQQHNRAVGPYRWVSETWATDKS